MTPEHFRPHSPATLGRKILAIGGGALTAVAVQPLVFFAKLAPAVFSSPQSPNGLGFILAAVAVVAVAAVLLLGIPVFLLLRKFHRDSWASVGAAGALIGALPYAFFWPTQMQGYSAGNNWHGTYVDTYINGSPTIYAWLQHGEDVLWFAIHGAIGALAFYASWRRLARAQR